MSRSFAHFVLLLLAVSTAILTAADTMLTSVESENELVGRENLARGKKATASSSEESEKSPDMAIDGNPETRWCANGPKLNEWWQVDLGKVEEVSSFQFTS